MKGGLIHSNEDVGGIHRRRAGRGFTYVDPRGRRLTSQPEIDRIRALAIPPAWVDVWICPDPRGHIQATGRDAKGRKQYCYHPRWSEMQSEAKFGSLADFGHALPALRARIATDMARRTLAFERVVATTVWLLDHTLIRVGNTEYSDSSYGLTTLLDDHAVAASTSLRLRFVGKSGKEHDVAVRDSRVARVMRQCQELPGQRLIQYVDGDTVRPIESKHVNDYIREATTADFTAKTFRTWGASAHATHLLTELGPPASQREAASQVREVIRDTAKLLGNTPSVCRQSYIHPSVLAAHGTGDLHDLRVTRRGKLLDAPERRLLTLLHP